MPAKHAAYIVVAAAGLLAGCTLDDGTPLPAAETGALTDRALADNLSLDIDRLESVLPEAFKRMHWGWVRATNELTALHAQALTPDDRLVEITAQRTAEGVAVQTRVGPFGDPALERQFLATLHDLADADP